MTTARTDRQVPGWATAVAAWAALLAMVLLAGLFTLHQFTDLDVLWHVRTGEWILGHGQVPHTDPFGGMTSGDSWLDVAWGAQLVAAIIADRVGLAGLQLVVAALVMVTLLVFARNTTLTPTVLVCVLLFVLTVWQRLLVRPDILTIPLTMIALALMERLPRAPRSSAVLLALLTALWVNLHGSFVLVPLLLLAATAGSLVLRAERRTLRVHASALLFCTLAATVNPYTFRIYGLFLPYLRSILAAIGVLPPAEHLGISEWRATWRAMAGDPVFPSYPFLLLGLMLIISFVRLGKGISPARILRAGALLLLALTAVRNVLPFAAAAIWIVAENQKDRLQAAEQGKPARSSRERPLLRLTGCVLALLVTLSYIYSVVTDRYYVKLDVPVVTGVGPHQELVPEGAVRWLAAHETPGRLFNNYNSGAYVLYRLYPHIENYIDSRFDITPIYRTMRRATRDPQLFDALVERDGIGTILLVHPSPESLHLLPRLSRDTRWKLVFRDENSTVHVRAESYPSPRRRTPIPLEPAMEPAAQQINAWLRPLKRAILPVAELNDAFLSGILRDRQRQFDAYRRALARSPENPQALRFFQAVGEPQGN